MAKVVSNSPIEVLLKSGIWGILGSVGVIGTLIILVLVEIVKMVQWYKEHIALNKKDRYRIDDSHF